MLFTRGTNEDIQQTLRDLEFAKTCNPQDYNLYVAAEFWLERALENAAMNEQRNELLIKTISVCSEGLKHAKVPAPLEIAIASAYLALGDIPKAEAQAKNAVRAKPRGLGPKLQFEVDDHFFGAATPRADDAEQRSLPATHASPKRTPESENDRAHEGAHDPRSLSAIAN
jgi:hypothetical protein